MQSIHGHDVMRMMLERPEGFTRQELIEAIVQRFGESARFHTCSAEGMSAEQLVEFLEARGKFQDSSGRVQTAADRICDH